MKPTTWVEVEEDLGPVLLYVGWPAFLAGIVAWVWKDFFTGMMVYLGLGLGGGLVRQTYLQLRLPRDAHGATRRAVQFFQERYPSKRVEGVAVRAVEAGRIIVSVRHGFGDPTPRSYFAVSRSGLNEITELDTRDWWPRGVK